MKRNIKVIFSIFLVVILVGVLAGFTLGCVPQKPTEENNGTTENKPVTIILAETYETDPKTYDGKGNVLAMYQAYTSAGTLKDILEKLANDNANLSFEIGSGEFGGYITSFTLDGKKYEKYPMVYTNDMTEDNINKTMAYSISYSKLFATAKGISQQPLTSCTYVIGAPLEKSE